MPNLIEAARISSFRFTAGGFRSVINSLRFIANSFRFVTNRLRFIVNSIKHRSVAIGFVDATASSIFSASGW